MRTISDYSILGYGVDIVANEPRTPIVEFSYGKNQQFLFQEPILIPDQFLYDPTPIHNMTEVRFSGVMETARDYQRNLGTQRGLGGIVEGIEFSGEASTVNGMFEQKSKSSVRQYIDVSAEYVRLRIDGLQLEHALLPEVRDGAAAAVRDEAAARDFFERFGTHIVKKAGVGGEMHVKTSLHLSVESSKEITSKRVDLGGSAKLEAAAFANGKIGFNDRLSQARTAFFESSSVSVNLVGGDITAKDADAWRESRNRSHIFSREISPRTQESADEPVNVADGAEHYLGPINVQYVPIYEVLKLSRNEQEFLAAALKKYLGGINPFCGTRRPI
jgi:hypothetical protein